MKFVFWGMSTQSKRMQTNKKLLDFSQYCDRVEFAVACLVHQYPHVGIIKVISVTTSCIEYEKIEPNYKMVEWNDVKHAVSHLHMLGVVYVNFTKDSFATKNGKVILNNFGYSGLICTGTSWKLPPVKSNLYFQLRRQYVNRINLRVYDKLAFDHFFKNQKQENQTCGKAIWKVLTSLFF